MRNLLTALVLALAFFACQTAKDEFSIKGTISGVDTGKVYLLKIVDGRPQNIDTAEVVKGKFSFNGKIDIPDLRLLHLNENDYFVHLFLDNSRIKVTLDKDSLEKTKIEGSPSQDIFRTYLDEVDRMKMEVGKIQEKFQTAMTERNLEEARKAEIDYSALMENMNVFTKNFVKEHNSSVVAAYITLAQLSNKIEGPELDSIVDKFPQQISQSEYVVKLKEIADGMRKTAIGIQAPDFTMNDPEGKPLQLSSLRGKVVMIDFWASWCGPCRQENPNVVRLYRQYHDKGFEILGVSLDNKKEDWVQAIQADQLGWLHVSDLQKWQSSAARLYAVNAIPQTFLLDKDGKIIAKGLRSEQLAAKLNELFPQ